MLFWQIPWRVGTLGEGNSIALGGFQRWNFSTILVIRATKDTVGRVHTLWVFPCSMFLMNTIV